MKFSTKFPPTWQEDWVTSVEAKLQGAETDAPDGKNSLHFEGQLGSYVYARGTIFEILWFYTDN